MRPLLEDVDVAQAVKRLLPVVHDNTRHTIIFCCSLHGTYLVRERRTRRAGQFRLPLWTSRARLVASLKEEEEEEEEEGAISMWAARTRVAPPRRASRSSYVRATAWMCTLLASRFDP